MRTVDQTKTPWQITVKSDADPSKKGWKGIPDPPPGGFGPNEGYTAELVWNLDSLGLTPGHIYRMQFMLHDGDQNKSGGDAGEACVTMVAPPTSVGLSLKLTVPLPIYPSLGQKTAPTA